MCLIMTYCLLAHTSESVKCRERVLIKPDPISDDSVVAQQPMRLSLVWRVFYASDSINYMHVTLVVSSTSGHAQALHVVGETCHLCTNVILRPGQQPLIRECCVFDHAMHCQSIHDHMRRFTAPGLLYS
jgi:hypothetical protein